LRILQDGFATLNRLEIFHQAKPSDFLQPLTVSLQNFFMSLSGFLWFCNLLSLATKRSCFATYKRALRNFRRERSIGFLTPITMPVKFLTDEGVTRWEFFSHLVNFPLHKKNPPREKIEA
jgi:hypothetical protein